MMKQKMSKKWDPRLYIFFLYLELFIPSLKEAGKYNKKQEMHWLTRICFVGVKGKHHMGILPAYFITVLPILL